MESEGESDGPAGRRLDAVHDDDFDSSPRPAKRRRVTGTTTTRTKKQVAARKTAATKQGKSKVPDDDPILDEEDAFDPPVPVTKAKRKPRKKAQVINDGSANDDSDATVGGSAAKAKAKRNPRKRVSIGSDEDGLDAEDEELDQAKKPKHRIHIPVAHDILPEAFLDNEPPESSAPWSIRGPIWKKDAVTPKQPLPGHSAVRPSLLQNALNRSASRPDLPNQSRSAGSNPLAPSPSIRTNMSRPVADNASSKPSVPKPIIQRPAIWEIEDLSDDIDPEDLMHLESGISKPPKPAPTIPPTIRHNPAVITRAESPQDVDDSAMFFDEIDPEDLVDFESDLPQPKEATIARSPLVQHAPIVTLPPKVVPQATSRQTPVYDEDFADELADLPSDAFESDPPSPAKDTGNAIIITSSQPRATTRPNLAPARAGLKQTTLFGGMAEPVSVASQANKRHAWPLATQKEPPTHHVLNEDAIKTWVYPTNLGTTRDYQYNIVARGLYHNLLVALPTGLGKTFIAATIMLNWYRWTKDAQIVFVAPTKPLVSQQIDACFNIVGIPRSDTVLLTGDTAPALRAEEWKSKRVFFMTPQTIINDLKRGLCDPKRVVLVVVDEAHRATGGYAYVEVIKFLRRFNSSFRVLALTATPGSNVEAVQQVIDGLDISRCEIRTETSLDIRQYVHSRDIDSMKFDYSEEQQLIMELASNAIRPVLNKLASVNAYWNRDPMKLSAFACTQAQRQWFGSEAGKNAQQGVKGMVSSIFRVLASLGHSISLLKFHGISPFYKGMVDFRNKVDGGELKGKYGTQIREDENFVKMMNMMQTWTRNTDFLGHPKLEYLRGVVMNHFLDAGEGRADQSVEASKTRVMIFAHWRDSAEEIVRVLKRNSPMIRPHVFVGQADSKGSEGMGQKRQLEVVKEFKEGKYNTLVATSIGEEGLDIGEVDLIVCYDASASPIRMLQRMGRTGRKRKGNIVLLLMHDKEAGDFEKAKDSYEKMQGMIASGDQFTFHDDRSPRIIPKEVQPTVDKRIVEIPVENSQAALPEPSRRKRLPKLPPKKFNMPDNVRTGFVTASRMDDDDDLDVAPARGKGKAKKAATTTTTTRKKKNVNAEPEPAPVPYLNDVYLNKVQERELQRKYQYVHDTDDGVPTVTAPKLDKFSGAFPGPTKYIKHGRASMAISSMMQRLNAVDNGALQDFKDNFDSAYLEGDVCDLMDDTVIAEVPENKIAVDLPIAKPAKTRKAPAKASTSKVTTKAAPKAKAPRAPRAPKAPTTAKAVQTPKPRGRPKKNATHGDSSDMEGGSSSPEPTPANMRVATQGIDLGSADTSGGEDMEGEEADSELEDFVVGSDAPIEFASSSMPTQVRRTPRGNRLDLFTSDDVREVSDDELPVLGGAGAGDGGSSEGCGSATEVDGPVHRKVRRRQVVDDDSDE